jgi:hypothetical protein
LNGKERIYKQQNNGGPTDIEREGHDFSGSFAAKDIKEQRIN